jgi:PPK2 family polyphosphate:nucleotide phosphotransferase
MKIDPDRFRARPGQEVNLRKCPTAIEPLCSSKEDYKIRLAAQAEELSKLQELLYAHNRYALLIILQAMDAAGKDGAIRHVMSGVNPQGCQVYSFKHPSAEELDHDFLWRTTRALPERGRIGIFNRSYYEEVLIVRVHPEILRAQNIPREHHSEDIWERRYRSIREHERHLHENGTRVIKFFLHISRDEQRQRLLKRIDNPKKNWKFDFGDLHEREHWDDYMKAYAACIEGTSTERAPWYIIPADDKLTARILISKAIVETLTKLKMTYPKLNAEQIRKLKEVRDQLV